MAETMLYQASRSGEPILRDQRPEEVTMKKKVSVFVFVGIALLLVFAAFGGQTQVSAKGASPTVPFKATYQTFPVPLGVVDGFLVLEIPAFGNGTHLGNCWRGGGCDRHFGRAAAGRVSGIQ